MEDLKIQDHFVDIRGEFLNTIKIFKIYLEVLDTSGFAGMDPAGHKYTTEGLLKVNDLYKIPPKLDENIKCVFNLFYNVYSSVEIINNIFEIFGKYKVSSSSVGLFRSEYVVTASLVDESDIKYAAADNQRRMLLDKIFDAKLSYNFADFLLNKLKRNFSDILDFSKKINEEYITYVNEGKSIYVYELYVTSLNALFDLSNGIKDSAKITVSLTEMLEKSKSDLMIPFTQTQLTHNRECNSIQKMIQTFRLVPSTEQLPLHELVTKFMNIKVSETNSIDQLINNVCAALSDGLIKCGFIVIHKVLKSPVIHNIDILINKSYIQKHDLLQPSTMGINPKTLERTCTIKPVKSVKSGDFIKIFNDQHGKDTQNIYYIIESIDGENYRILHPWGMLSGIYSVPADMYNFIGDIKTMPSLRIEAYNNILENEILSNIQERLSSKDLLQQYELKMEDSYWGGVRGKIRNANIHLYSEELSKLNKVSEHDIYALLTNYDINQKVVNTVAILAQEDLAEKLNITDDNIREQFKDELSLTYCIDMLQFRNNFSSKMREAYNEQFSKDARRLLGTGKIQNSPTIINALTDIIKKTFDAALITFISRFNGVFISMKNKMNVLEKTLLPNGRLNI